MVISIFCAQVKTNFTHLLFPISEVQKQPLKPILKRFHYSMLLFPLDDMYFSHVFSTIDIRCHIRVL
nr:hypothetical protein KUHPSE09_23160 [Staphylococcus epidermidis]